MNNAAKPKHCICAACTPKECECSYCRAVFFDDKNMSPRNKQVVDMYFNHGLTQRQIAEKIGVSRSRINVIVRQFSERVL